MSRSSRYPRVEEYLRSSRREYRLTKHVVGNEKWVQELPFLGDIGIPSTNPLKPKGSVGATICGAGVA